MLKKCIICLLLLSFITLPSAAFSRDRKTDTMPSGKWWKNDQIAAELNLTDDEKQQLDTLFIENRRKLIDLKSGIEKEQLELSTLLEQKKLDETALRKQFEKLEAARTKLAAERFAFLLQVRKMLGHDRFQQLKDSYGDIRKERLNRFKKQFSEKKKDRKK